MSELAIHRLTETRPGDRVEAARPPQQAHRPRDDADPARDAEAASRSTHTPPPPEAFEGVPTPGRLGKKICIASASGDAKTADRYDRQMLVYALIEGLYPQLIYFAKTARPFGDWVANRAARWTIDGKPAPMIGLFRLISEQTSNDEGRWYLPKPSLVGKLGQANGPDIAWERRAAGLRRALKGDCRFE